MNLFFLKQKQWAVMLLGLFITKSVFLVGLGPPFFGEDEANHFGYIEALARTEKWFLFDKNRRSVEALVAVKLIRRYPDNQVISEFVKNDGLRNYRDVASVRMNATAYQPPIYYWIMAKLVGRLSHLSILDLVYVLRLSSVLWMVGLWLIVCWLSDHLIDSEIGKQISLAWLTFWPLVGLLSATITVQTFVFFEYSVFIGLIWWWLKWGFDSRLALALGGMMVFGLLTQQALMAIPVVVLFLGGYLALKSNITRRQFLLLCMLVVAVGLVVSPEYFQRHQQVKYTETGGERMLWEVSVGGYLSSQTIRIKEEVLGGMWDQTRSMIPYYADENFIRTGRMLIFVALVGWVLNTPSLSRPKKTFWLVGLVSLIVFLGAHLWYDLLQFRFSAIEYFKARYLFPLLGYIVIFLGLGLSQVLMQLKWKRLWFVSILILLILFNFSAISWLWIKLPY